MLLAGLVWQEQVRACVGWGGPELWPCTTCREHQSQVLSRDSESHLHSQSHEYAQNLLNYAERKDVNVYANLVLSSLLLWNPKKSKGGPNPGETRLERLEERRLSVLHSSQSAVLISFFASLCLCLPLPCSLSISLPLLILLSLSLSLCLSVFSISSYLSCGFFLGGRGCFLISVHVCISLTPCHCCSVTLIHCFLPDFMCLHISVSVSNPMGFPPASPGLCVSDSHLSFSVSLFLCLTVSDCLYFLVSLPDSLASLLL